MSATTQLTQEQKRILIAEACGYADFGYSDIGLGEQLVATVYPGQEAFAVVLVPDYFHDLNACHAAESEIKTRCRWTYYETKLVAVILKRNRPEDSYVIGAPSDIRAEAIGLALGLWE